MTDTEVAGSQIGLDLLLRLCLEWHEVGSRVTCDPPSLDTDRDVLCLVKDRIGFVDAATREGFVMDGSVPANELELHQSPFTSLKRGEDNLIVTDAAWFASRFMVATRLAKRFNLQAKVDRVALFQAVLYGNGEK
jgi:hypothetical protein